MTEASEVSSHCKRNIYLRQRELKTIDARFSGVGLFRSISACRATDIWTETEVMKEMENRFKTMPHLQSVMVKKTYQGQRILESAVCLLRYLAEKGSLKVTVWQYSCIYPGKKLCQIIYI